MTHDPLEALLRLRRMAADEASRGLAECLRVESEAAAAVAAIEAARRDGAAHRAEDTLPRVDVPVPDLRCFNQLLSPRTDESPVSVFFA